MSIKIRADQKDIDQPSSTGTRSTPSNGEGERPTRLQQFNHRPHVAAQVACETATAMVADGLRHELQPQHGLVSQLPLATTSRTATRLVDCATCHYKGNAMTKEITRRQFSTRRVDRHGGGSERRTINLQQRTSSPTSFRRARRCPARHLHATTCRMCSAGCGLLAGQQRSREEDRREPAPSPQCRQDAPRQAGCRPCTIRPATQCGAERRGSGAGSTDPLASAMGSRRRLSTGTSDPFAFDPHQPARPGAVAFYGNASTMDW